MAALEVNLNDVPDFIPPVSNGPKIFTIAQAPSVKQIEKDGIKHWILNVGLRVNDDPEYNRMVFRSFRLDEPRDLVALKKFVRACGVDLKTVSAQINQAMTEGLPEDARVVPEFKDKTPKGIVKQSTVIDKETGQQKIYANVNDFLAPDDPDFNLPVTPA